VHREPVRYNAAMRGTSRLPSSGSQNAKPQPQPRPPDRTWLWALVTLLALSLGSFVLTVLAISGGRLPDLGGGPSWTPAPLETQAGIVEERPVDQGFAAGARVVNASAGSVNLRRTPGFQNKPDDDVLLGVPSGSQGTLIDGPQSADGLKWWRVRFGDHEGWMAQQSSRGLLLLDLAPQ